VQAGRRDAGARSQFDVAGALTVTCGLVVLTYGIVQSESHGWGSARTLLTLAGGAALLAVFLVVEGRLAARPLVPLRIFASRALSGANVVVFCLGSAVFAMWYFVSLYMQQVLGYSPIEAGVAFLPMPVTIAAVTQAATRLTGRHGPGPVLAVGMALIGAGMLLFARIAPDGGYVSDVLGPALLCSAGIGFSFVPVTIAATTGVRRTEAGLASGLVNTSRQMGGSLGLALLATLATQRTAGLAGDVSRLEALTEGFQRAFAFGAAFALCGALISALVLRGPAPRSA
jgi:predicted MFS family arabinose efflux permease